MRSHIRQQSGLSERYAQAGMTLVQAIVLIVLVAIIVILALPPFLENRKLSQAVSDVEMIADACEDYFKDTGEYCTKLEDLTKLDPKGKKYLEKISKNPWGGSYVIDLKGKGGKIGIPKDDQKVPEKYRFGGIAEVSKIYKEGASLW